MKIGRKNNIGRLMILDFWFWEPVHGFSKGFVDEDVTSTMSILMDLYQEKISSVCWRTRRLTRTQGTRFTKVRGPQKVTRLCPACLDCIDESITGESRGLDAQILFGKCV